LFSISISALQAFQTAISVTSNNIANADTPGYADESVDLATAAPQDAGGVSVGSGVEVGSISRAFSQLSENQYNTSQSGLGQADSLQTYTSQLDNIIGTTAGGLTTALQNYYDAWSTVANDPTSTAARQALIGQAQSATASLNSTNSQLQTLNTSINTGITADVQQINSIAQSIGTLNQQIVTGTADAGGAPPNDLIDQRDALVSSLSQIVGVSTTTDQNGALNVFVGNGQPLVLEGVTTTLTTVPNQFNASQLEVSTATDGDNPISAVITSGDLGGLLAARTTAVDPAINQLGQIAGALSASANAQQNAGLDLSGNTGADLFSVAGPLVTASRNNTDATTATASVTNVGTALSASTADNYLLTYKNGAYSLTDTSTGDAVAFTNTGTPTNPVIAFNGLSVALSATPAAGDQFLIQPTAQSAGSIAVALTNPTQIAAAAALTVTPAGTNTGTATLGQIANPGNLPLPATTTIKFTSATQYLVNGTGTVQTVGSGGTVNVGNWTATLSGTPAANDSFTFQSNAGATGDNTNALASAGQQSKGVLSSGTISISSAVSDLVTGIGSQAQRVNTAQTAQKAVNASALTNVQSVSGVDLNTEAANLLQWQEAYQASAQALSIGNSVFASLLAAVNAT
jgi:flagellar hook-associated protein 1 FlgK